MILIQMVLLLLLVIGDCLNIMDGIIFLVIFAFYMRHLIKKSRKIVSERNEKKLIEEKENFIKEADDIKQMSIFTACTLYERLIVSNWIYDIVWINILYFIHSREILKRRWTGFIINVHYICDIKFHNITKNT